MSTPSASEALSIDPALVARFRQDVTALGITPTAVPLALAVSGGPDSMAMLALARAAFPGTVIAATVDHGLRAEAADEAATVGAYCASLGVAHTVLCPDGPIVGASIQAQAREARYALLRNWIEREKACALATAHHADDQAETFLMRAMRGSGVGGLAGIRARRELRVGMDDHIPLIRPLLGWRKEALRIVAEHAGAPFVDDDSNSDPRHDRSRIRQLIERTDELDVSGLAASAAFAAEAEATLSELADHAWLTRRRWDQPGVEIDLGGLPLGLRRRLIRTAIATVREAHGIVAPAWTETANVEPLLIALEAGTGGTQAGVMASAKGDCWRFQPAPPRRSH